MDVELHIPSRPTSSLSQVSAPHATSTTTSTADNIHTTLTPPNVKQWADYQAAIILSNHDGYYSQEVLQSWVPQASYQGIPVTHGESAYSASYGIAGLGIGQPETAYTSLLEPEIIQKVASIPPRSVFVNAHQNPNGAVVGYSSSTNEVESPLTWSPDSGHTEAHPPLSIAPKQAHPQLHGLSINVLPAAPYYQATPQTEDNEATIKRHSYNPVRQHQLGSYFSSDSSQGLRSASHSPAPGNPTQWRRAPLPFANGQDTRAQEHQDGGQSSFGYPQGTHSSLTAQSIPPIQLDSAGTPQVVLSPAFQDQSSVSRPWSPGDYLVYNGDPSQITLPPSTAESACSRSYHAAQAQAQLQYQQRSVSPQTSLLAPHPIYTNHTTFPPIAGLSPDYNSYTHGFSHQQHQHQQRHYSNTSATSASSLAAFRFQHQQYAHHYRNAQYSPMASSVGSYHSESADEGEICSGTSSSGAFRPPSLNLAFSPSPAPIAATELEGGSPYASPQYFFGAMQIHSPAYSMERPTSSLSNYSSHQQSSHPAATLQPLAQSAPHLSLHRSISHDVPRRPSAVRYLSHPYHSVYAQYIRPHSVQDRKEGSRSPPSRCTPDLSVPTGQQEAAWVLPSEEDVRLAAIQYSSPVKGGDSLYQEGPAATGYHMGSNDRALHNSVGVEVSLESSAGQETVMARRETRSASKARPLNTFFERQADDLEVPTSHSAQSTSVTHPSSGRVSSSHSAITLPSLDKLPSSGKVAQGKHSSSIMLLGQTLLPLHMLPTKRSRGRRPVISPDLDIAPSVDSTTASTVDQVSFTGVTKTGKPKKIFVCRVPGCDKCFRRSEHLKRHIRSIHTHDKPFACTFPTCSKAFARFDNLKQHQKNIHVGWTPPHSPGVDAISDGNDASLPDEGSQFESTSPLSF